jgi:hypothetical protein
MGEGAGSVGDSAEMRKCAGDSSSTRVLGCRSVMVSLALSGLAALSSVSVAVGDAGCIGIEGEGAEWRCACLALLRSCSSSSVSSSSTMPSRLGAVAALGTSRTLPLRSAGRGDLVSRRLKTFIELRRGSRAAFSREARNTLCVERSSA